MSSPHNIPIRAAFPIPSRWIWLWHTSTLVTVVALLTPLLILLIRKRMNMQATPSTPFRFMDLPPELRDMVYEYLLEDPYYPPPPASEKKQISPLSWIMSSRTGRASVGGRPEARKSNWVFLVNRQVYTEYMDLLCKKTVFRLTVSPANYPKDIQSITSEPLPGSQKPRIWRIAPETLQQVKRCDLKLITTSSMLGVPDPRNMTPASWGLAKQVREELKEVKNVHELNLHVKAIGDPLWNPLWVWYHASQAFKSMGSATATSGFASSSSSELDSDSDTESTDTLVLTPTSTYSPSLSSTYTPSPPQPLGPKLNRITFSLDTWSPGENYLSRDADGKWAWWCMAGHCVGFDGEGGMTVREFCARLYADCVTCRPESSGENEDEDV